MNAVGAQTLQTGTSNVTFSDTQFVNLPATGANGFDPATFALSLFSASANRFLNLELSALEADGKGKVVSSPRVITADQQKAIIEQGEELPYQVATSSGATSLQFRKANLKLEVTPQVTPEGNVILDVDITKDSVGRATTAGFAINTKHVRTQVLIENGGTVLTIGSRRLSAIKSHRIWLISSDFPTIPMSYRPPSDPLARPRKDKKQPWPRTAIYSIGRAASVPRRPRTIPTPPATSRCWRGWSPSASAPPCISAAPTNGRCTISWPRCSTTPWTRPSPAMRRASRSSSPPATG
jgi:hypothetical protein